tara:strand:- start:419 stop:889 length:471 start_codon:yes stop_codon:yes gene_type:complete
MSLLTKLTNQASAAGFTHKFAVTHEDLTETSDRTGQTLTVPVSAGQIVTHVSYKLVTAFNDSGGGDELDVEVGDGADPDGYLDNTQGDIHTDQTPASYGHGLGDLVAAGGKVYTGADTLDFTFFPDRANNTPYNLAELNAGEIHFYLRILDMSEQT